MKRNRLWCIAPAVLVGILVAAACFSRESRALSFEEKLKKLSRADRIEMHEVTWTRTFDLNESQTRKIITYARDFEKVAWPRNPRWVHFRLDFYSNHRLLGTLKCAPLCPQGCSGADHGGIARDIMVDGYPLRSQSALALIQLLSLQNQDA